MSAFPRPRYTPEQYLEIERKAERKSEYFDGEMFAMAGVSFNHTHIVTNLVAELGTQLRGRACSAHSSDLRVQISAAGLYTYPDVVVVCGEPRFADTIHDMVLNPSLIIEVLSPSTESYDRGRKFLHDQTLESLTDYILVAQDEYHVDHYVRQPDGDWLLHVARSQEDTVAIASIDCRFVLSDIYERVRFEASPPQLELTDQAVEIEGELP